MSTDIDKLIAETLDALDMVYMADEASIWDSVEREYRFLDAAAVRKLSAGLAALADRMEAKP